MAAFHRDWVVAPHGEVERLNDGLVTVAGEIPMPLGRFPRRMTVVSLAGGRSAVWSAIPLAEPAMAEVEALGRPSVLIVPGVGGLEAALVIRRAGDTTLVLNDLLANVRHPHGLGAKIMARVMGFGVHGPRIPWLGKRMFVKDAAALAAAFRRWEQEPHLKRVIVSHGDVIDQDPRGALGRAAASLA